MARSTRSYLPLTVPEVACTPDGNQIVTGDSHGQVIVWNLHTGLQDRVLFSREDAGIERLSISPNGRTLLIGSDDWTVSLLELSTSIELYRWKDGEALIRSARFSADGHFALIGGLEDKAFLWSLDDNKTLEPIRKLVDT